MVEHQLVSSSIILFPEMKPLLDLQVQTEHVKHQDTLIEVT